MRDVVVDDGERAASVSQRCAQWCELLLRVGGVGGIRPRPVFARVVWAMLALAACARLWGRRISQRILPRVMPGPGPSRALRVLGEKAGAVARVAG